MPFKISALLEKSFRRISSLGYRLNVMTPTFVVVGPISRTLVIDLTNVFMISKFCGPTLSDISSTKTMSALVPLQPAKKYFTSTYNVGPDKEQF